MALFNEGQELVCICSHGWFGPDGKRGPEPPLFNDIVTFSGMCPISDKHIALVEHPGPPEDPNYYPIGCFEPLVSTPQLMEDLKEETHEEVFSRIAKERHRSKAWI